MPSALPGRRALRSDSAALSEVRANGGRRVIQLGEKYLAVVLEVIERFKRGGHIPIPQEDRDVIIAKHVRSPGGTVIGQLRDKGAIQTQGPGGTARVDIVPNYQDVIYVNSRSGKVAWPPEMKGQVMQPSGEITMVERLEPEELSSSSEGDDRRKGLHKIGEGAYVLPPTADVLVVHGVRLSTYTMLLEHSRASGHQLLDPRMIRGIVRRAGLTKPTSVVSAFDHDYRVFIRESGKVKSHKDPCMRSLVIRPYVDETGTLVVPEECHRHPTASVEQPLPTEEPVPVSELQVPTPQIRSKSDLQAELEQVGRRIESSRSEQERLVSERAGQEREFETRIANLKDQLEAAERELETLRTTPSERKDELAREIEAKEHLQARLIRAIDAYDDLAELLLVKPS